MRLGCLILTIIAVTGCGGDRDPIVGVWSVLENESNQVYEIEFFDDGKLQLSHRKEASVGQYALIDIGEHRELEITWSNGSQVLIWVQFLTHKKMKFYDKGRNESILDFKKAVQLSTLTRLEMPPNKTLERTGEK